MNKRKVPKYKVDRRLLQNTWGSDKSSFIKKKYRPGQHKFTFLTSQSSSSINPIYDFLKIKAFYANMSTKQIKKCYNNLLKNPIDSFIKTLEIRLDTILFRTGASKTFFEARQIINHKHVMINDKKVNIPSIQIKINDTISFSNKIIERVNMNIKTLQRININYLKVILNKITLLNYPKSSEIKYPFSVDYNNVARYITR